MHLHQVKSKNATSLYIIESIYTKDKKRSSRVVKKLGTLDELSKTHADPLAWGTALAKQMTEEAKAGRARVLVSYDPTRQIPKDQEVLFNGGYLFLQKLYYALGLDRICSDIAEKYKFEYNLNDILRTLVFGRILFPKSKAATYEDAKQLLEPPKFAAHDIYRALDVLARENDFIQSELYRNTEKMLTRNDRILFYDCTNFFFELENEGGLRQYGVSKEHRPNPIVQLGLFMDADGIPLAFSLHPGNTNEQVTLKPLEQKIVRDFGHAHFIVCTDAGLASQTNRRFNTIQGRGFITTQSLKKMKDFQKAWALDPDGWQLLGSTERFNLETLKQDDGQKERYRDAIFYKERWFHENGLEQRYIVTYSLKYKAYQESLRNKQLNRAVKMVEHGQHKKKRPSDPARFIEQLYFDDEGSICDRSTHFIDQAAIENEAQYDGFYCTASNLEDEVGLILKVNRQRWEIEESFRILKSEFRARPVYLSRDERITAHFLTCFLALYLFRILETKLKDLFTCEEITQTLRRFRFYELPQGDFIPAYKRSTLTDELHHLLGSFTDFEVLKLSEMRKIIRLSKKP